MRFYDFDFFSKKKPVGSSFHVYVMQAHARKGPVAVAGVEKMLAKVPWALGDVSLYSTSTPSLPFLYTLFLDVVT